MSKYSIEYVSNRTQWDQLIEESVSPTVYHTWEWKTFLEKRGHICKYVLVKNGMGEVEAGCGFALSPHLRFFRIYNSLPQPGIQGGGPLYRKGANKQHVCDSLIRWLGKASLSSRIVGSRIITTDEDTGRILRAKGTMLQEKRSFMIIDLEKTPPDAIWNRIFTNKGMQRKKIRKLERIGFEMKIVGDRSVLQEFERLHRTSLLRLGAPTQPGSYYADLWDTLYPKYLQIGISSLAGDVLCALMILPFAKGRAVDLFLIGYDRETHGNISIPLFMFWKLIEWAQENRYRFMNLGGTPNNPNDSHYRFKVQFGAQMIPWHDVRLIPHSRLYSLVRRLLK